MRYLLDFFIKNGHWFLFLALEVICGLLLFRFNNFQASVGFTTASEITGRIYSLTAEISSYFNLKETNRKLTLTNAELWVQNQILQEHLSKKENDSLSGCLSSITKDYKLWQAQVINNSISQHDNYITINRGRKDGIKPEMGIISGTGVVGIVCMTSDNYSLVISLLNSKSSISCKFKNNNYFGYLKWKGKDPLYAHLDDIPRHARFEIGDSIVTSGYSAIFPKGIMIGTVEQKEDSSDGLSYSLKIRLATDFAELGEVVVISNEEREEQHLLESKKL